MTDRHGGYLVTLAENIREDDAEPIMNAIRMITGVLDVRPIVTSVADESLTKLRVDNAWKRALIDLVQQGPDGDGSVTRGG